MPIRIGSTLVESLAIGDKAIEMIAQGGDVIHTATSNMLPMPMIDVTETVFLTGSDITLTCNANDPDHATGFTYTWSENADFSSPFATVTGAGTTNVQTVTGPNAAGAVIYYCQVEDDAGGIGSAQISITWALGLSQGAGALQNANFDYPSVTTEVTFSIGGVNFTNAGFPTTNTAVTSFQVRDGANPTDFATSTSLASFGGLNISSVRASGANLILVFDTTIRARNFMAVVDGEAGWNGTGSTAWSEGIGGIGLDYFTDVFNISNAPILIIL